MCLNITERDFSKKKITERESDGGKLNASSLDIVVSENSGWYHVAIALETRCQKTVWICIWPLLMKFKFYVSVYAKPLQAREVSGAVGARVYYWYNNLINKTEHLMHAYAC